MKREVNEIVADIKMLLDELIDSREAKISPLNKLTKKKPVSIKGAIGAVKTLIDEGFFDTPKDLGKILERLKEIGHYHPRPAVSMNLLNLTKKRVLNRLKSSGSKNWQYVVRK